MAKRKSTAEELLDLITDLCFHLPVWEILLTPIIWEEKGVSPMFHDSS
jgi:hypothetical protein